MDSLGIGKPLEGFAEFCRKVAAEGAILLKNKDNVLPLKENERVSIFGRCQIDYYRSGTGSGGRVNVEYTTNLLDGLRSKPEIKVNEDLAAIYQDWIKENPFNDGGGGWAPSLVSKKCPCPIVWSRRQKASRIRQLLL